MYREGAEAASGVVLEVTSWEIDKSERMYTSFMHVDAIYSQKRAKDDS